MVLYFFEHSHAFSHSSSSTLITHTNIYQYMKTIAADFYQEFTLLVSRDTFIQRQTHQSEIEGKSYGRYVCYYPYVFSSLFFSSPFLSSPLSNRRPRNQGEAQQRWQRKGPNGRMEGRCIRPQYSQHLHPQLPERPPAESLNYHRPTR
jgi:hypothetical protein